MALSFIVPGTIDQLTGGYLYDRHIVEGLAALGRPVELHQLPGRFPEVDSEARNAAAAVLARLGEGATAVIDGLALPAFIDCLAEGVARHQRLIGLVHHPLALETGLPLSTRETLALAEARLLPRLAGVLCPSRTTAWHMEEYGVARSRIAVAPPGTAKVTAARQPRSDGSIHLLSVATISPRKGQLLLVDALAELKERPWRLTCIGSLTRDRDATLKLERAIAQHGLGQRVLLAGEWPPDRLGAAYAEADVFVLPSYHEGYGMALAEALVHGLPIVATTAGAIPETVPADAAMLVPPGDRASLVRALAMIIDNAPLRQSLAAAAARAGTALPDWPAAVRGWVDALDRLVAAAE